MTTISWCMFILGLAIGLTFTGIAATKFLKDELKAIQENHDFLLKYAEVTDRQYENLQKYVDDRLGIISNYMDQLADISMRMASENKELGLTLVNAVKADHEDKNKLIKEISNELSSFEEVYGERWNLVCDYIMNNKPGFNRCATCKYKAPNGGPGYTYTCDSCSEASYLSTLLNYEPEEEKKEETDVNNIREG